MLIPMVVLAGACAVIGFHPGAFIFMPLKAVAALGLDTGRIAIEPVTQLTTNITLGATLFLVVVAGHAGRCAGFSTGAKPSDAPAPGAAASPSPPPGCSTPDPPMPHRSWIFSDRRHPLKKTTRR
ncbi:MAG: hypothetical protein U5J82_14835 [Desulfobacterales bacterium]|nr:hypothetical protein [Desulfobacterales bacterium]